MIDNDTLELVKIAARKASEKKAFEIIGMDVSEVSSFTDVFLLCSASSGRHLEALAEEIQHDLKRRRKPLHVESTAESWILMDYGDFILHLFTEERRAYYKLDSLWGDAPRLSSETLGIENQPG